MCLWKGMNGSVTKRASQALPPPSLYTELPPLFLYWFPYWELIISPGAYGVNFKWKNGIYLKE